MEEACIKNLDHAVGSYHNDSDLTHVNDCGHDHDHSLYISHSHSHAHAADGESFRSEKNLKIAFILTLIILSMEFVGALISKSMALYSDSGHILVDASSLLLAWFAQAQVRKNPTRKNTYGYHRIGILAALLNSALLLLVSLILVYESYLRLIRPEKVNSGFMIIFASFSFIVNLAIGFKIHKDIHYNLNLKSSFFHVMGDSLISISIVAAGIIIYFTKYYYIDPIIGLLVSPIIAIGAISVIKETMNILLEAVPKEIDFTEVKNEMLKIEGIKDVHDLHIWSMSKSFVLLSSHILVDPKIVKSSDLCCIINNIQDMLEKKFKINHTVIQPEFSICERAEGVCVYQNR